MSLIEKIDERISQLGTDVVRWEKEKAYKLHYVALGRMFEAKAIKKEILSEQEEPRQCTNCNNYISGYCGFEDNISEGDNDYCNNYQPQKIILSEQKEPYMPTYEESKTAFEARYPGIKARTFDTLENIIPDKLITIGDKIRESNESLSRFIRGQFGGDRVLHGGSAIDLDEFLNQPYTETN